MTSPPSWTVVVFEATEDENESVQAVPSLWINGDQCVWPPLPGERINIALRKGQYSKAWPSHKVRILRNSTYGKRYFQFKHYFKHKYEFENKSETLRNAHVLLEIIYSF